MQYRISETLRTSPARHEARALLFGVFFLLSAPYASALVDPVGQVPLTLFIQSIEQGHTDMNLLGGPLAQAFKARRAEYEQKIRKLGALKSVKLRDVTTASSNIYDVEFEHAHTVWLVGNVSADGRIGSLFFDLLGSKHEDLVELSCVGPGSVTGRMIWINVIATPEFHCSVGSEQGQFFSGGPRGNLGIPINVVFRNPGDADGIRLGARATVGGHFFLVNDVTIRAEYLVVRDAVIEQGPKEDDITLPSHVYQTAQSAQPPPKPKALPPEPDPNAEAALRHIIETIAAGKPDYRAMTPAQAEHVQHVRAGLEAALQSVGAIKSMTLRAKNSDGQLIYDVVFEMGANQFSIRLTSGPAPVLVDAFSYGPHLADEPDEATLSSQSFTNASQTPLSSPATNKNSQPEPAP